MSTQPSTVSQPSIENLRGDSITYGAVHLDVADVGRSLAFWRDLIGLSELSSPPGEARLGVDARALVVLHGGAVRPAARGHAGLYHLAIHLQDEVEFARAVVRIAQARMPQSPTDHIFSKATYLNDPDGILLELTLETPERLRTIEIEPGSVALIDSDGRRRGGSEPLDVEAAIAPLAGGDPQLPLAGGSYIGHVHLHVADLAGANAFYRDVVGFREHAYMAAVGMADLGAGGRFPHRIALNDWNGRSARQAEPGTAGMRSYELLVAGDELERIASSAQLAGARVERVGDALISLTDPAGSTLVIAGSR